MSQACNRHAPHVVCVMIATVAQQYICRLIQEAARKLPLCTEGQLTDLLKEARLGI